MAVETVYIGRHFPSGEDGFGIITEDQMRAVVFDRIDGNLWIDRVGFRGGRNGGSTPSVRVGVHRGTPGHEPDDRYGYSAAMSPSTAMTGSGGGADYEAAIAFSDYGPLNSSIPAENNIYVALSLHLTGSGALGHSMKEANAITADEERFFDRSNGGSVPPDPYGAFSAAVEGHVTVWARARTNEEPRVPVDRTPHDDEELLTPQLQGDFQDRNGTWGPGNDGVNTGDYLKQYQVKVRRASDNANMWSPAPFTASPAERTADRFNVTYAGTTLVRGTEYEWQARCMDHFGEWGEWADWLAFTPTALGLVVTNDDPTGKQNDTTPDFEFDWTHQTALSTNAVRIQLYQDNELLDTSGIISKTVANGAMGTITFAETGFATLAWGANYKYEIQGRDTNNVWSNYSTPRRSFAMNKAPTVPSLLSPINDDVVTSPPLLIFTFSDQDDGEPPAGDLLGKVRIKDEFGVVIATRSATWNPTAEHWEYQTVAVSDLTDGFAPYRWDAYAYDGTVYSGETTVEASAAKAPEEQFIYANGPTVVVTDPTYGEHVPTGTPTIHWTASAQNRWRQIVYAQSSDTVVYLKDWEVSDATKWAVRAGYLRNETTYEVVIEVEDLALLVGTSERVRFRTEYTAAPAVEGFSATPVEIGIDPWPTAIRLEWQQTTEPSETFNGYKIYKADITDRPWAVVPSASATALIDYTPRSGIEQVYTIRVEGRRNVDETVESDAVVASATVDLRATVLTSVRNPATYRAVLDYVQDRSLDLQGQETVYGGKWNQTAPTTYRRPQRYWMESALYHIHTNSKSDAQEQLDQLLLTEEFGGTFCVRNERSDKRFVVIPRPGGLRVLHRRILRADVEMTLRDEHFIEGVQS